MLQMHIFAIMSYMKSLTLTRPHLIITMGTPGSGKTTFAGKLAHLLHAQGKKVLLVAADTFRAAGAGGQHINKTESAIRITHVPTGTVVECQDERSQHKNRARAMSLLASRLLSAEQEKQHAEQSATRKLQVGSGDRSERIRTYNYPQGRITDHRINLTLYKLDDIMQGGLEQVIQPLISEHQAELLTQLGED